MQPIQIVSSLLILLVLAGASYLMHMVFGWVGVGLLLVMTVAIVGIMSAVADFGGSSSSGDYNSARMSKGARQGRDER